VVLAKVNPFKTLLYIAPQGPIFVCMFLGLKRMAQETPISLHNEGILWFTDLAVSDPMLRLPILAAIGQILTFELGADAPQGAIPNNRKKSVKVNYISNDDFDDLDNFIFSSGCSSLLGNFCFVWNLPSIAV